MSTCLWLLLCILSSLYHCVISTVCLVAFIKSYLTYNMLWCVSSTCGIVHCYGGGNGFYRDPNDIWKGFPVEMMYVDPRRNSRNDPKYVQFCSIIFQGSVRYGHFSTLSSDSFYFIKSLFGYGLALFIYLCLFQRGKCLPTGVRGLRYRSLVVLHRVNL